MLMGIVVIAVAIVFARVKLPEITQEESTTQSPSSGKLGKAVLFGFVALLAYEVAEISINSYFVIFLTSEGVATKWKPHACSRLRCSYLWVADFWAHG